MRWRFAVSRPLTPEESVDLESIAGVYVKRSILAPENAVSIVRGFLDARSIAYSIGMPIDKQREIIRNAHRVRASMRPEVPGFGRFPDFLMPWQVACTAASIQWPETSGMFHHAAGSGKTLSAILWGLTGPGRIIVVTKAAVKYQWAGEIRKFTVLSPTVLEGETARQLPMDAPILVLNYDILPAWIDALLVWCQNYQIKPSLILDESQIVQSHKRWDAMVDTTVIEGTDPTADPSAEPVPLPEPKVTFSLKDNIAVAAMRLSHACGRRLSTTATPARDRVRNLWGQLDLLHPGEWGGYWAWAKRYANARERVFGGMDDSGGSNFDELRDRLRVVTHRVRFAEANALLPPKRRIVTYIPIAQQVRAVGASPEIKAALKAGNPTLVRECLLMEAAGRKRRWLIDRAKMVIEDGQRLVIFTGRRRDCDDLLETLKNVAPLVVGGHGGHSAKEREAARVRFMESTGPALLIGTTDAWGEGVNLQTAHRLIQAMLPYTPGAIIQAEGRVCRLGQLWPVIIEYPVAEGTIDERVSEILLTKLPALEKVIDQDEVKSFGRELIGADDLGIMQALAEKILNRGKREDDE